MVYLNISSILCDLLIEFNDKNPVQFQKIFILNQTWMWGCMQINILLIILFIVINFTINWKRLINNFSKNLMNTEWDKICTII